MKPKTYYKVNLDSGYIKKFSLNSFGIDKNRIMEIRLYPQDEGFGYTVFYKDKERGYMDYVDASKVLDAVRSRVDKCLLEKIFSINTIDGVVEAFPELFTVDCFKLDESTAMVGGRFWLCGPIVTSLGWREINTPVKSMSRIPTPVKPIVITQDENDVYACFYGLDYNSTVMRKFSGKSIVIAEKLIRPNLIGCGEKHGMNGTLILENTDTRNAVILPEAHVIYAEKIDEIF